MVDALLHALPDKDDGVRIAVLDALGQLGMPASRKVALDRLVEIIADPTGQEKPDKDAAFRALARLAQFCRPESDT